MPSTTPNQSIPVTVENFIRAESDRYFGAVVRDAAGIGKMLHNREVTPIDKQTVVRQNRDTLYSAAVFDLVRFYRPCTEILNGSWKFPEAQPVN
jgi:hypothetical protein